MFSLHGRGEVVMPEPGIDDALLRVKQFLQENTPFLQGIICSYVVKMGLAHAERDFFDQFAAYAEPGKKLEEDERVNEMLALVSKEDQEVLRLALLHELDMKTVARILHVTPGTARVRLHRAIHRLRIAWKAEGEKHV